MQPLTDWTTGYEAWQKFTERHPELGYKPGRMNFHNFLRFHRNVLVGVDALRIAKRKFWIAHVERFCAAAFDCATSLPRKRDAPFEVDPNR